MENKQTKIEKYSPVGLIQSLVEHVKNGTITLPDGYNFQAAINAAMYLLSETTDKNNKPALEVCTKKSINYSLMKMVLLGLNPLQKQGYFIVYGNELQFQQSYFGDRLQAERAGITDIVARVVYDGDQFDLRWVDGHPVITHIYRGGGKITHAYCLFTLPSGKRTGDVMTFEQLSHAWAHSKDPQKRVHAANPEEMAKRTVTRRALKPYINSFSGEDYDEPTTDTTEEANVITLDDPEEPPAQQGVARPNGQQKQGDEASDNVPF